MVHPSSVTHPAILMRFDTLLQVRAMTGLSARGMKPLMAKMTPEEEAEEKSIQAELDRKMRGL
jgi:hypothetical protein